MIVLFVFSSDTQVDDAKVIDSHRVMIGFVFFLLYSLRYCDFCYVVRSHRHGEKVNFQIVFLPHRLLAACIFLFESSLHCYS